MKTECKKCGAAMPACEPLKKGPFAGAKLALTAYACRECGHWNDLKKRKGYADWKSGNETPSNHPQGRKA